VLDRKAIEEITGIRKSGETKKARSSVRKKKEETQEKEEVPATRLKLGNIKIATNEAGAD
jgi:hypothetical protein